MKKFIGMIITIALACAGYFHIAPLFIDKEVNEAFPEVTEDEHPQTQEEIDAMTDEEKEAAELKMIEEFADKPDIVMEEEMPEEATGPEALASGQFIDADNFHKGSGSATVFQIEDSHLVRFENFSVTNGPDLRIFLVEQESPTKDQVLGGLELGKLKGNKGNQNYDIPAGTDVSKYKSVVVFCKPYKVIFSTANLK